MLRKLHTIPAAVLVVLVGAASPGLAAQATPTEAAGRTTTAELPSAPASAGSSSVSVQNPSSPPAPTLAAPSAVSPGGRVVGLLEDNLSPWGMFLNADLVVKAVICGLVFASLLTWTIWLAKSVELVMARRRLQDAFRSLREASSLGQAAESLGEGNGVARAMVRVAQEEWRHSADALDDRDGLKERISLYLQRIEAATGRRMMVGTGVLATIGSTAPFVGLFGTVWGIMNSFVGIARLHTTNLAAVAPGIAEALLATAIGLIVAIPAVVIYNHFARQIGAFKAQVADAGAAVMRLASRDLSRGAALRLAAE